MEKSISLKKVLIIILVAVLVICIGLVPFFFIKDILFSLKSSITVNGEQLAVLSNKNYICFDEGFTDIKVTDEKSALEAISSVSEAIEISDVGKELKVNSINSFDGETFYRMQQYYNDIPVYGKDVVLVSDENGLAISLTANSIDMKKGLEGKNIYNDFDNEKGISAIEGYFDKVYSVEDKGPYYIAFDINQIKLTHLYNVLAFVNEETVNLEVCVSNSDYKVVFTNDLVNTDNEDYSYKVSDGKYYMFDEKRNIVMLDSNKGLAKTLYNTERTFIFDSTDLIIDGFSDNEQFYVYYNYLNNNDDEIKNDISNNFSTYVYSPIEYVTSNNNTWDKNAVKFMKDVEKTYDYYKDKFNRKGYDDKNGEMFVTYNDSFGKGDNAYSNGNSLCFGYKKGSSAVDLAAHEFTHSVEGSISGMIYEGESGALMEAYSDIFGELVENYANGKCDWKHNKGRNLKNPSSSNNPSVYRGKNWGNSSGSYDNGYVHDNSTVISHAAYLMNNGIDGNENMKIDTDLLAKIWYKSLYMLHSDATLNQCADAVYNAALMTKGVTFEQRVCIRAAFSEVGFDVKYISSYTVPKGTTVYAISKDNKKYGNYHVKVIDYNNNAVVDEKDITNAKGYKLDLNIGKYVISLSDNNKNGSKNTFYKTINLIPATENEIESYINILTDFYFDYDARLKEKLSELIDKYGIASDETYTANLDLISNSGWTNRKGIVSAKLSDLDCDGINELVVARLIGGKLTSDSENIEIQVYYSTSDGIKLAGSLKFYTGDDLKEKQIDSFIYKIGDYKVIILETDFSVTHSDVTGMYYYVLKYGNGKFYIDRCVYRGASDIGARWIERTWNNGVESEKDIFYQDMQHTTATGTYKDSDKPVVDYFVDFGLLETDETFPMPGNPRFFNIKNSKKLFELIQNREDNNHSRCNSSLRDYTGLDHSKATTTAEKVEEWKDLYISYLSSSEVKLFNFAELIYLNDDDIPELILQSSSEFPGVQICWIDNGKIKTSDPYPSYGASYNSKTGLFHSGGMRQGIEYWVILCFDGHSLETLHSGNSVPDLENENNTTYSLDGKQVSESEYIAISNQYDFEDHIYQDTTIQEMKLKIKDY